MDLRLLPLLLAVSACGEDAPPDEDDADACGTTGTLEGQLFEADGDTPFAGVVTVDAYLADAPETGPDDGGDPEPSEPVATVQTDADGAFTLELAGDREYWIEPRPWTGERDGEPVLCEFEEDRAAVTPCETEASEVEVSDCEPARR